MEEGRKSEDGSHASHVCGIRPNSNEKHVRYNETTRQGSDTEALGEGIERRPNKTKTSEKNVRSNTSRYTLKHVDFVKCAT